MPGEQNWAERAFFERLETHAVGFRVASSAGIPFATRKGIVSRRRCRGGFEEHDEPVPVLIEKKATEIDD